MVARNPSWGMAMNSAWAPNGSPLKPNTRSPTAKEVTSAPTASKVPANSVPRILTLGLGSPVRARTKKGLPARKPQSVRFTVVALTLTSTWLSLGVGLSTSAIRTTSGGP
jgi:hypothetical protein